MSRVQPNGMSIEVERYGDEISVPVLLICGFGSQLVSWPEDMIDALTGAGFFVIAMDKRNVGLSEKLSKAGVPDIPALRERARILARTFPTRSRIWRVIPRLFSMPSAFPQRMSW